MSLYRQGDILLVRMMPHNPAVTLEVLEVLNDGEELGIESIYSGRSTNGETPEFRWNFSDTEVEEQIENPDTDASIFSTIFASTRSFSISPQMNRTNTEGPEEPIAPSVQTPADNHEGRRFINLATRRLEGGPDIEDYGPRRGRSRDLIEFYLPNGSIVRGFLPDGENIYQFADQNDVMYVNQHTHRMAAVPQDNILHDGARQRWVRWADWAAANGIFTTGRRKGKLKKLRRKYAIPEIKEEKYYATKDFIA